jgi:hypothetical protein
MVAVDLAVPDNERTRHQLIAQADIILNGQHGDTPRGFPGLLFGRAALEDLQRCRPKELAILAARAWTLLQQRSPGVPKIRLEDAPAEDCRTLRPRRCSRSSTTTCRFCSTRCWRN